MRKIDQYMQTIDTIYPDGYARESYVRDSGDMLDPQPLTYPNRGNFLSRLVAALRIWREKRRGRLVLRDLTDDELDDIGISRSEARREVQKSWFWN